MRWAVLRLKRIRLRKSVRFWSDFLRLLLSVPHHLSQSKASQFSKHTTTSLDLILFALVFVSSFSFLNFQPNPILQLGKKDSALTQILFKSHRFLFQLFQLFDRPWKYNSSVFCYLFWGFPILTGWHFWAWTEALEICDFLW